MGDKMTNIVRAAGLIIAAAAAYFTGLAPIYQALFVLIFADMISGAFRAFKQKEVSSEVAYSGVLKKVGELMLVAVAVYIQQVIPGTRNVPLPEAIATFYVYTEAISLLENLAAIGVPIPQFLKDALAALSPDKFKVARPTTSTGAGREG